ncbi:MAG TPA: hypothetical protein VF407_18280 [Polyangiaceae bacterium]
MALGDLEIVDRWLDAVNGGNRNALLEVTGDDVEIVGPKGSGHGKNLLADWLLRAGFHAHALRWFCGANGRVVVEQDATWATAGHARVASAFEVKNARVVRFQRFDKVEAALAAWGLRLADEVTSRQS